MRSLLAYFWVDKPRVIYFVLCCALVLVLAWKRRDTFSRALRWYIVLPSAVLLVILLNPAVAHLLVTKYEETRALRFFWLVPVTLLLAAVTVLLVDWLPGRRQKVLAAVAVPLVLVAASGGFRNLRATWQNQFTNWYKVPEVVIRLDDWIAADEAGIEKTAVFPTPLNLWVRQYRPEIQLPYEWTKVNKQSQAAKKLYEVIEKTEDAVDLDEVNHWAVEGGYNYIVLDSGETYAGTLSDYEEVYRVDVDPAQDTDDYDREYILYRLAEGR